MKSDNNCIIKVVYFAQIAESLFFRLDQPVRMRSPECTSQNADYFYNNRRCFSISLLASALSQMEHFMCTCGLTMATACVCPLGCPLPHFSFQKGAREGPLCSRYAPSTRTSAEPTMGRAPLQTSTRQSKRHYVMKVRTPRKTARVQGAIWDRAEPSSSVLHSMTRKLIELSHLEGLLNSLIALRGGEERGAFQRSYEQGYTGVSYADVFFIEKTEACVNSPPSHLL